CARLGGSLAVDIGEEDVASHAAQLLYRLGGKSGDVKLAQAVINDQEQFLTAAVSRGDLVGQTSALLNLGAAYAESSNFVEARQRVGRALAIAGDMGSRLEAADALDRLAGLDWTQGRYTDAADRFEAALGLLTTAGAVSRQADLLVRIGAFGLARFRPTDA